MEKKLTNLDVQQIQRYSYDEENNAQRVVIVNQESKIPFEIEAKVPEGYLNIVEHKDPIIIKETVIERIDVPVYISTIHEIPKLVTLVDYREISVPFPVRETVIERIEIPIITEKIQIVEVPKIITEYKVIEKPNMKMFYIGFGLGILIMLVCHFVKF